jgi:hypothetical protein
MRVLFTDFVFEDKGRIRLDGCTFTFIGEDHILDIRPLGTYVSSDWPSEYVKLAPTKKLGKRQRAQLSRSPGIEVK